MKTNKENEKYNRFLKRKEINLLVEHPEEATPSMAALQQLVAKENGVGAEKVEVVEVKTPTGSTKSKCLIFIWDEKTVKDLSKKESPDSPKEEAVKEGVLKKKIEEEVKEITEETDKK
jgi:ribosomal protein S24E